jgi:hypothetical protein
MTLDETSLTEEESDGLIRIGPIKLSAELPTFNDEFYEWKRNYWANKIREDNIRFVVAPMVDQR